jgi:uncharacterized OsmC-like protein
LTVNILTTLYANAKLVDNFKIDVDDGRAHAFCLDLDRDEGRIDMGPSALELALMSYAGCYATIFALTAQKMRLAVNDLRVKAKGVKTEEAGTIAEVAFDVSAKSDAREDRLRRCHDLTVKGCPVGRIFEKAGVKATYALRSKAERLFSKELNS